MALKFLSPSIINFNPSIIRATIKCAGNNHARMLHTLTEEVPVKEIQIPTKWGYISGKLWGNENERPILATHGWQDNAGTWEPLAPLLSKKLPILAIDFPGHGLSSWLPPGMQYCPWDLPRLILYIKDYFKWDKVSFLGHSMGSVACLRFACIFPEDVDFYIAIDSLVADDYDVNDNLVDSLPNLLRKALVAQSRLEEEPPSYELEELIKICHYGTNKSVALDSAHHLLKRGVKESKRCPGKYHFSRDPRLKTILFNPESKKFVEALVRRLKCPTLHIRAIDSHYAPKDFSIEMRELIQKNNDKFEYHFVAGTHHFHLNDPDTVAPIIRNFLHIQNLIKQ